MIVKTIILNVSNSGDYSYRETFTIFHDKKHESDFEIEKNNWEDWCNSERENMNSDDDFAEKYWVDFLGYSLTWVHPNFELSI